jgi:catechol 2,3-dioxygenase-like lactoylglutathione lyase family enzyme
MSVGVGSFRIMNTREVQITLDCADPAAQASFWCEVLGYRLQPPPSGFDSWDSALDAWGVPPDERNSRSAALPGEGESGPRLFFQRVPEGKTAKNRMHLDVRAAPGTEGEQRMTALDAEATRLVALGATRVRRVDPDGRMETGFVLMQDPEGNEFCLD